MRKLGILLAVVGLAWLAFAFNLRTTVSTESQTISIGPSQYRTPSVEVSNIGLMDNRRTHLTLAGLTVLVGVIFIGFGTVSVASEATGTRKCPFCAEQIQWGAIKCRHCNADIPAGFQQKTGLTSEKLFARFSALLRRNKQALATDLVLKVGPIFLLLGVWVLYFPTTVEIDLWVCQSRAPARVDNTEAWGESIKQCMGVKRHSLKPSAIAEVLAKNEKLRVRAIEAKASMAERAEKRKLAEADQSPTSLPNWMDKEVNRVIQNAEIVLDDVAKSSISTVETSTNSNWFALYIFTQNWE